MNRLLNTSRTFRWLAGAGLLVVWYVGLASQGGLAIQRPVGSPRGILAAEPKEEAPQYDRQIRLLYTINNLGYAETCG